MNKNQKHDASPRAAWMDPLMNIMPEIPAAKAQGSKKWWFLELNLFHFSTSKFLNTFMACLIRSEETCFLVLNIYFKHLIVYSPLFIIWKLFRKFKFVRNDQKYLNFNRVTSFWNLVRARFFVHRNSDRKLVTAKRITSMNNNNNVWRASDANNKSSLLCPCANWRRRLLSSDSRKVDDYKIRGWWRWWWWRRRRWWWWWWWRRWLS